MFTMVETDSCGAVIKVIGLGGGGGNTVQQMVEANIQGVEFICANTDVQALDKTQCKNIIRIGQNVTKGLGAGANPEVGRQAALEDRERIKEVLEGTDMVFITAGMGGGTGTGAAPVVAQIAKEMNILTVAVVTKPFPFEGARRMKVADKGIEELEEHVDSLITIPNAKLLTHFDRDTSLLNAFKASNDVLHGAVQGISELITCSGMVNVDFADVKTVMSEMGMAMMGTGIGRGDDRAAVATELAINSPLLEDIDMHGAKGILINVTSGMDLSLGEFEEIGKMVEEYTSDTSTVVIGNVIDMEMDGEIRVTVVATGLNGTGVKKVQLVTNPNPEEQISISPSYPQNRVPSRSNSAVAQKIDEVENVAISASKEPDPMMSEDYLDIPAFLRNQAD
ncbi:MAG: cell division protein FtsZ [Proteobacteria bacterium]|nr:cell division protein FtsZ [Pseudomonadota bacterium]